MLRATRFALLSGLLALTLACSTTVEKQDQRFKRNLDSIEALMAKNPMLRPSLAAKVEAFKAERAQISGDEEAQKKALVALNRRVEEYTKKIDPAAAAKPAPGAKPASLAPGVAPRPGVAPVTGMAPARPLGGAPGLATPSAVIPPGSKLGAPPAVVPASGIAPPVQLQPAPTGKLGGPAPAQAPASGKLGGY